LYIKAESENFIKEIVVKSSGYLVNLMNNVGKIIEENLEKSF